MQRKELIEWITKTCRGPIVYDSIGSPAPSLDWTKMVQNPELLEEIARHMANRGIIPATTRIIVGITNRGASVGEALAKCYDMPFALLDVRNGVVQIPEGQEGVCLVDDTSRTNKTMKAAYQTLLRKVSGVGVSGESVVVLDRFQRRGVNSLFNRMELRRKS